MHIPASAAGRISTRACRSIRAFTLVELLVVIGIIALLISILLPALNRARAQANALKCATQLREIGNAMRYYSDANRGYYAPVQIKPATGEAPYVLDGLEYPLKGYGAFWYNFLNRYVTKNGAGNAAANSQEANDVRYRSVIWGCTNWDPFITTGDVSNGFNTVQTGYGMNGMPTYTPDYPSVTTGGSPPASQWAYDLSWTRANSGRGFVKATTWGKQSSERCLLADNSLWLLQTNPGGSGSIRNVPQPMLQPAQAGDAANYIGVDPGQTTIAFWRHGQLPPRVGTDNSKMYDTLKGRRLFNILYCDGHVATTPDYQQAYLSTRRRPLGSP